MIELGTVGKNGAVRSITPGNEVDPFLITWTKIPDGSHLVKELLAYIQRQPKLHHIMEEGCELTEGDILIQRLRVLSLLRRQVPPVDLVIWGALFPFMVDGIEESSIPEPKRFPGE